jgi:hypothetical protein
MGMRAGLGAVEDKSLLWLRWEAPSVEVAADFTGIYKILMWKESLKEKTGELSRYQSTSREARLVRVWREILRIL